MQSQMPCAIISFSRHSLIHFCCVIFARQCRPMDRCFNTRCRAALLLSRYKIPGTNGHRCGRSLVGTRLRRHALHGARSLDPAFNTCFLDRHTSLQTLRGATAQSPCTRARGCNRSWRNHRVQQQQEGCPDRSHQRKRWQDQNLCIDMSTKRLSI